SVPVAIHSSRGSGSSSMPKVAFRSSPRSTGSKSSRKAKRKKEKGRGEVLFPPLPFSLKGGHGWTVPGAVAASRSSAAACSAGRARSSSAGCGGRKSPGSACRCSSPPSTTGTAAIWWPPTMGRLLALAESVDKLQAICMVCGAPASRTQRLVNGEPAHYSDPIIMVGAREVYEARCREHHVVPGKPQSTQPTQPTQPNDKRG